MTACMQEISKVSLKNESEFAHLKFMDRSILVYLNAE